jgi:hypothetical protein
MRALLFWGSFIGELLITIDCLIYSIKGLRTYYKEIRQSREWFLMSADQRTRFPEKKPTFPFRETRNRVWAYLIPRMIVAGILFSIVFKIFCSGGV